MKKRRIAVISKRQRILEFFKLEAESCLCSINISDTVPLDAAKYDVLIVDDDGSYVMTDIPQETYRIIPDGEALTEKSFYWPVAVEHVREMFEGTSYETSEISSTFDSSALYLIDEECKRVVYKNREIILTDSEQRVLYRLIAADGAPVSREELLSLFDTKDGNIADVYICHLRRKLETPFGTKIIRTVRGRGYALLVKVEKYSKYI